MKRLAAAIILYLLAVATGALWARSYWAADEFPAPRVGPGVQVRSWHGRLFFKHAELTSSPAGTAGGASIVRMVVDIQGISDPPNSKEIAALRQAQLSPTAWVTTAPRITLAEASWSNGFGFGYAWSAVGPYPNMGSLTFRIGVVPYWFVCVVPTLIASVLMLPF